MASSSFVTVCVGWSSVAEDLRLLEEPTPPANYKDEAKKREYVAEARAKQLAKAAEIPGVARIDKLAVDCLGEVCTFERSAKHGSAAAQFLRYVASKAGPSSKVRLVAIGLKTLIPIVAAEIAFSPPELLGDIAFMQAGYSPMELMQLVQVDHSLHWVDPYFVIPLYRMTSLSVDSVLLGYSKACGRPLSVATPEASMEAAKAAAVCLGIG